MIAVVARNKNLQNRTNFYVANLAACDLLVALCCMWVHLVSGVSSNWVLGATVCALQPFALGEFLFCFYVLSLLGEHYIVSRAQHCFVMCRSSSFQCFVFLKNPYLDCPLLVMLGFFSTFPSMQRGKRKKTDLWVRGASSFVGFVRFAA